MYICMYEAAGGSRNLHDEILQNLYSSPDIIRIQSRSIRWAEHVARMGDTRNKYIKFGWRTSEDLDIDRRIILKQPYGNRDGGC
jgi:hypothetical protein